MVDAATIRRLFPDGESPGCGSGVSDISSSGGRVTFRFAKNLLIALDGLDDGSDMVSVSVLHVDAKGSTGRIGQGHTCRIEDLGSVVRSAMARYGGGEGG